MIQDTSTLAYAKMVLPTIKKKRLEVLNAIKKLGIASNEDIRRLLGWPINCVTGRVKELRDMKLVEDAGKAKQDGTGSTVHLWQAVNLETE